MAAPTDQTVAPIRAGWGRATAAGLVAFVVAVLVLGWGLRLIEVSSELEPAGPTCSYELDPGSGPSGYGTERRDWGLLPTRVCVSATGEVFRGDAVDSTSPLEPDVLEPENAPWWIGSALLVLVVSAAVGGLTARAVRRRPPR